MQRKRDSFVFLWVASALYTVACGGSNRDFESSVDASAGNEAGAPDARGPGVSVEASGDARLDAALDGPCTNGAPCSPANPCHEGQATCSGAQLVLCADTQRARTNGSACGVGSVCHDGACGPCSAGTQCTVANKPCRTGTTDCSTGLAVCNESGCAPEGMGCGQGMVCASGACVACMSGQACTPTNPCHT